MFRVLSKGLNRFPGAAKQEVVEQPGIDQTKTIEVAWKGEDNMEVPDRKQVCFPFEDPLLPIDPLTFRAVTVAAGIIRDPLMPATVALVEMAPKLRSAALLEGIECAKMVCRKPVRPEIIRKVSLQDVGYLIPGPFHPCSP
jgi:hypothetical protein